MVCFRSHHAARKKPKHKRRATRLFSPQTADELSIDPQPGVVGQTGNRSADTKRFFPLWVFFCLSAASAWTVWLWPLEKQGSVHLFLFGWRVDSPFALIKLVIGNCLPGILAIIWTLFEGKQQLRLMFSTLTKFRTPLRWYLLAVTLPCGVFLVSLDTVLFYFPTTHSFPPLLSSSRAF